MRIDKLLIGLLLIGLVAALGYWLYEKQIIRPTIFTCINKTEKDCLTCCEKTISKDQPVDLSRCVNECMNEVSTTMGD